MGSITLREDKRIKGRGLYGVGAGLRCSRDHAWKFVDSIALGNDKNSIGQGSVVKWDSVG